MVDVREFRGEYRFLSNFWPAEVIGPGGRTYPSVEHAYQASKTLDSTIWTKIRILPNGGAAKHFSRSMEVRPDWHDVRLGLMEKLLRQKFAAGSELAGRLVTVDGLIEEGNGWGDVFWGIDLKTGEGENNLGRLLMAIRDELTAAPTAS
jgi:ribA/ribD-fused uncharacterized protein